MNATISSTEPKQKMPSRVDACFSTQERSKYAELFSESRGSFERALYAREFVQHENFAALERILTPSR